MKNIKNKNIAIFISVVVVAFFFLFGHILFKFLPYEKDTVSVSSKESNLSFIDMTAGDGSEAKVGDSVTINFVLRSPEGDTIASSLYSGPVTFVLGGSNNLSGLDRSIVGMKVSGKRVIVIPPMYNYAFTENGPVKSETPLVFEVELLSIN
jgi:FKBP-type peptidyl-prolyl cis-trans isomerase